MGVGPERQCVCRFIVERQSPTCILKVEISVADEQVTNYPFDGTRNEDEENTFLAAKMTQTLVQCKLSKFRLKGPKFSVRNLATQERQIRQNS